MRAYYDHQTRLMDTDAAFSDHPIWDDHLTLTADGKRWQLHGVHVRELSAADLAALFCEWIGSEDVVNCSVEDNGNTGDGLWLCVTPTARAVREEHDGGPEPILRLRLTPQQARVLGAALTAAALLRDAQGDEP